jgi:hypothetical protein
VLQNHSGDSYPSARGTLLQLEKIEVNRLAGSPDIAGEQHELVLAWKNRGQTPATITRVGIGRAVAGSPPHNPMYHFFDGPAINATVDAGEEYVFRTTEQSAISTDQRKQIELGIVSEWLWGEIQFNDGARTITECGFVASRGGGRKPSWRLRGPQEYIYARSRPM